MGIKMAECEPPPVPGFSYSISDYSSTTLSPTLTSTDSLETTFLPYWARYETKCAQNLLDSSDEPIEYDHDDEDYSDNCFFFPEDCSWTPSRDSADTQCITQESPMQTEQEQHTHPSPQNNTNMIPGLPDIKMLDAEALSDLLEDNLSPPEITTIMYCLRNKRRPLRPRLPLSSRQLRNLSATYGAAYTCYAKTASSGNLTGVNPASHPSSYVTAKSISLGDVGSIVFELDDSVAVVTRIADKVLVAAVGPSKLDAAEQNGSNADYITADTGVEAGNGTATPDGESRAVAVASTSPGEGSMIDSQEVDRSVDLARLAGLNLSAEPAVLLALESKCAALARFLGEKLHDLESPEDF
ncbi:uncharacterized protein N7515_005646 [Penicillium bovifimosum]|uniref:Uncharacterized protein n=1 Tax=Penicillium bovifimosum TaxID=126998 RepID=A0A9W9GTC7_9EURO|nr:uncharacterized protein N7515_005646 [Penicillium bovifimosum]KAJ5129607.1 hypothetical protein N7515_005646 [Penicillium bovifimosum]